eukprot:g21674.t2
MCRGSRYLLRSAPDGAFLRQCMATVQELVRPPSRWFRMTVRLRPHLSAWSTGGAGYARAKQLCTEELVQAKDAAEAFLRASELEASLMLSEMDTNRTMRRQKQVSSKAEPAEQPQSDAETEKDFEFITGISSLHHMADEEEVLSGETSQVEALTQPGAWFDVVWGDLHASRVALRGAGPAPAGEVSGLTASLAPHPSLSTGLPSFPTPREAHSTRAARDAALFWGSMYSPPVPALQPARVLCVARRRFLRRVGHRARRKGPARCMERYNRKDKFVDFVGEYHLDLIQDFGGAPIIVPRTVGTLSSLLEYLPMDGLLVVEGNDISDDVLRKYHCCVPQRLEGEAAEQFASDTEFDISKDELECALMRFALMSGCPILGLCRGSQMLNVLRGGTLYGDLAAETGTTIEHLQPNGPTYDSFRHPIHVHKQTPLAGWFEDSLEHGRDGGELLVNSYHHQGSRELGKGLREMACAPDGITEAFYDEKYDPENGHYVVGLQFHPERMLEDYPGCRRVYENFLRACCAFRQRSEQ